MGNFRSLDQKQETAYYAYERKKEAEAKRQRMQSAQGAEIGSIPECMNPDRREECRFNLRLFCEVYLPEQFPLAWSEAHLAAITRLESSILNGGLFAYAMRRGGGKTTLARAAVLWATLYGHRNYVVLIAATDRDARKSLRSIKTMLQHNDELLADFPEVIYPIRHLGGVAQRAQKQTYNGEPTNIHWKQDAVIYADIPGAEGSQAVIETIGITGAVRGRNITRPDGTTVRPSFVLLDDPQKKTDARSPNRIEFLTEIINGDVLGLAGPGEAISAVMTCTIIEPDDLAERYLDHTRNPMWQGQLSGILESLPTNEALWLEYSQILAASFEEGTEGRPATEFYRRNQAAMDEGAKATWPECFEPWQASAIQNAMTLKLRNENAFWAEYMNQPRRRGLSTSAASRTQVYATIGQLARRLTPFAAGNSTELTQPSLTGFIDVHLSALYWMMVATDSRSIAHVIDYGTWPEQNSRYFSLGSIKKTIAHAYAGHPEDHQILAAIADLLKLLKNEWLDEEGNGTKPDLILVDAGWGAHTDTIFAACKNGEKILPSKGTGIGPAHRDLTEWTKNTGDKFGDHSLISAASGKRKQKSVWFDSNYWKSRVHRAFQVPAGSSGGLSLFKGHASDHELLADHIVAEYPIETFGRGRRVDVWNPNPGKPDNHWLDCLVGCHVAHAILQLTPGFKAKTTTTTKTRRRGWSPMG